MQAYISALNFVDKIGRLQLADSSESYGFSDKALANPEDFAGLSLNLDVSFDLIDGKVRNLVPAALVSADSDGRYFLPDEVSFENTHLRAGYEILDVGRFRLAKTARDENKARVELASLCRALGGNTLLEVTHSSEQKTAMGYAFIYHTYRGYAAVAGRPDEKGDHYASELLQSINHREIERRGQRHENVAAGKIALRILGGVLLLIFCAGYIFTTFF